MSTRWERTVGSDFDRFWLEFAGVLGLLVRVWRFIRG